jgi:hypothetical protein
VFLISWRCHELNYFQAFSLSWCYSGCFATGLNPAAARIGFGNAKGLLIYNSRKSLVLVSPHEGIYQRHTAAGLLESTDD